MSHKTNYVDKKTGQIYDAVYLDLSSICNGALNEAFAHELLKLSCALTPDGKGGCIDIKVKVEVKTDIDGNNNVLTEATIATKYPRFKLDDIDRKRINDDGKVVKVLDKGLFDEEPER